MSAAAGRPDAARSALHRDVVGIKPLQLGVEVRGMHSFLRGQLQRIGERFIPLAEELQPAGAAAIRTLGSCGLKTIL